MGGNSSGKVLIMRMCNVDGILKNNLLVSVALVTEYLKLCIKFSNKIL